MENSPKFAERVRDFSSWQEGDIAPLSPRSKKKYKKRKSAIEEYITTEATLDEIALRNHISTERLLQLFEQCMMQAPDGKPWGFRALVPGITVVDHSSQPVNHEAEAATDIPLWPEIADEDTQTLVEDSVSPITSGKKITAPLASEELLDSEPEIAEEDTQALVEDSVSPIVPGKKITAPLASEEALDSEDEDTSKRKAVKPSLSDNKTNAAETPLPTHLADGNETTKEITSEHDESTVTLPPLMAHQDTTAKDAAALDVPTIPLKPPAEMKEEIPATLQKEEQTSTSAEEETSVGGNRAEASTQEDDLPAASVNQEVVEPDKALLDGEETITGRLNDDDGKPIENVPVSAGALEAIAQAVRILDEEKEGDQKELIALNGHLEEKALLRARSSAPIVALTLPGHARRNNTYARKVGQQRRMVRKRLLRNEHIHNRKRRSLQVISFAVLAAILLFVLVPVGAGFAAYGAYNNISGIAHDGVNHLLKVKSLLPVSKSDPTAALNAKNLIQAQIEFKAAEGDFVQLQQLVNRTDVQAAITQFAPQYTNKLGMAQRLVQVALDVSHMGNELCGVALIGANVIHGSPLSSGSTKPVISAADVSAIEGSMVHALYYIDDIQAQMSQVSIKDVPISDSQKKELVSVMDLLPTARDMIVQAQGLTGLVAWLLGVGGQRRYLVQTMDKAELRPGGGFTGQYGILQIQDGRMSPFTLKDVTLIDYAGNGTALGRTAPPGYNWMNFGNWGVRDSNLSGDFPTTARMTMQLYQDEGGGPVDGDIAFTPTLIGHILDIIGPIKVPGYNETITSKNLEDRLHYYQQDFSAIAREKQISGDYSHAGRKAFTSTLGKLLLDRVRHAQMKQLVSIIKGTIKDIQSRDLEIYFTNPAAEALLVEHGYSGSIDTFAKQDGFTVVQANISISKASQYVHTTEQDTVKLDAQGGATHNLTITLDYQQKGPVYGFDTYADYIRVYAPRDAQLISGDGFDTGKPLCRPSPIRKTTSPTPGTPVPVGCSQYNSSFPSNARNCPNGDYALGLRGGLNAPWVVDSLGAPTALSSDLPGRAMWGGLTETPKNCISYISLSWYVPHAVKKVNGQPSYTLLIQKQSGYSPTIQLSIDTSDVKGLKTFNFQGDISADKTFTLTPPANKK